MSEKLIVPNRAGPLPRTALCGLGTISTLCGSWASADTLLDITAGSSSEASTTSLSEITVTAQRLKLLGSASTASEGIVTDEELQLLPAYRPGQLLETVPGLIVTLHSGEGKANQFLLRGYNLDHGTDIETYVDGMPINMPTHTHGQGYTDLNFMIPEVADSIRYTKGPYYADVGDFGAVGSLHVGYRDAIDDQVSASVGTRSFQRIFSSGTTTVGDGHLLAAMEVQHYDGPGIVPDDARKEIAVVRYSTGDEQNGYSITAMTYHNLWTNNTDIPVRAITEGVVPNRFGSLDPTDAGRAWRSSLSFNDHATIGNGQLTSSAFFIDNQLHMWNNFTHYLVNPVTGDQELQYENRRVVGGQLEYTLPLPLWEIPNQVSVGVLMRDDMMRLGRSLTMNQIRLPSALDPPSFFNQDQVYLYAGAAYVQAITHWTSQFRSVLGFREDYQHGTDVDYLAQLHETVGYSNAGTVDQALPQPKGSLIYTVNDSLELYASAGRGFHSADVRGVLQDINPALGLPRTSLLSKQEGQEVGLRAAVSRKLSMTFAFYNLWQQSETIINPDVGSDTPGPPSRRYGFELNTTYKLNQWLEFYGSVAGNHARFTHPLDDGTGHLGYYITAAPLVTGSLALYLTDFGPWSGGLDFRYLGNYPLSSGPCNNASAVHDFLGVATSCANAPTALGQVNGKGFGELNLDVKYAWPARWSTTLGIYNLLNTHAAAAQFWYVDRLRSEIGTYPAGRADVHEHPLEPIMARFTVTKKF